MDYLGHNRKAEVYRNRVTTSRGGLQDNRRHDAGHNPAPQPCARRFPVDVYVISRLSHLTQRRQHFPRGGQLVLEIS
jgi:hypothetical protein